MATAALRISRQTTHKLPLIHRTATTLSTASQPSHHNHHSQNHAYLPPTTLTGSFIAEDPPKNPKQAEAKLARLRRDYAKQVKEVRKQYIQEMELHRQEKLRKEEARKREVLRLREERRKSKAAAAEVRAAERKALEEEFRNTLMKERAEKLEYWQKREKAIQEKKSNKKELIRKQSSGWIDEEKLEALVLESVVATSKIDPPQRFGRR